MAKLLEEHEAFVFDFDGVVVDSLGVKAEAFAQLFSDLGPEIMEKVKAYHLNNGGVSRYEKFKYYYRVFRGEEITDKETAELDKQYSELVVQKVIGARYIPGVQEVLEAIRKTGKFCCIVSATPEQEIRYIVQERGLGMFFKEVLGSPRSKKDNLGDLVKRNGLVPGATVYFGDAKSDYDAAQTHGVKFIGVLNGSGGELAAIPGILTVEDFSSFVSPGVF